MRFALLTAFGLGHLRPAPGTWGSLPPVALVALLLVVVGPHWTIDGSLVLIAVLFSIACVRFGHLAEARFGRKDPGQVVADEVAGQAVTLLALPWNGSWSHDGIVLATGFLAFRVADILKPPPANGLQRIGGGTGILVDDLAAAVYAAIATQLVARVVL